MSDFLSPKTFSVGSKIVLQVQASFNYTEPISKVELTKKAGVLFISEEEMGQSEWTTVNFNTNSIPKTKLAQFIGMQTLIKSCADNAEDIKDRFVNINKGIATNDTGRAAALKLDFMKLKDNFMDFLKSDPHIKSIDEYSSNQKMKPLRKKINQFVLDRNIYTHGQLCFLAPSFDFVIEYIDHAATSKQYAYITNEILVSYNGLYKDILNLISHFHKTRPKSTIQK